MSDLILSALMAWNVPEAEEKSSLLHRYVSDLMLFNPTLKLVGDKTEKDIIVRHILDSAAAWSVFMEETRSGDVIADLGSGAGLPGIVLSILFPDRTFVLVERMQRRVGFLRGEIAMLGLKNCSVLDKDMKDVEVCFDAVTCRAFHPLIDVAEDVVRCSSRALMYKGRIATTIEEAGSLLSAGYTFRNRNLPLEVPGLGEERHICLIEEWRKG